VKPAQARARNDRFDGTISRDVLENYLSRAISMEGLLNGRGDLDDSPSVPDGLSDGDAIRAIWADDQVSEERPQ
jgi:hypothetical protein